MNGSTEGQEDGNIANDALAVDASEQDAVNTPAAESSPVTRRIVKLTEETINRIAAGEVVQRPASALKELLENSIDAGSKSIKVIAKEGGLKQLSIQDTGSGIKFEDLPLLCERFATSKLTTFEDLSTIQTYGFRGEALASISHVAHLTVTTKTRDDACGWKACYRDGKLVPFSESKDAKPRPIAATDGTLLVVDDLFYNSPTRRKALKSSADEYSRILDVVSKYAIHNAGISMSCKKFGTTAFDLQTSISSTTLDVIGQGYSSSIRRELTEINFENSEYHFKCKGYVSSANYSAKRGTFIFFINHRLVDCTPLKRNLEAFYTSILPKGGAPFIYLALNIHPNRVDVNVSPTKSEVHFLDQDDIIELICEEMQKKLSSANQSRTFNVQTLLPGTSHLQAVDNASKPSSSTSTARPASTAHRLPPQKLVRTDAKAQTLDSMINFASTARTDEATPAVIASDGEDDGDRPENAHSAPSKYRASDEPTSIHTSAQPSYARRTKIPISDCDLTSIQELRAGLTKDKSQAIEDVLKAHTFVGVIDLFSGRSMLQHGTKLFLVDHNVLAEELFYQLALRQFTAIGKLNLKPAPSLHELLEIAIENEQGAEEHGVDTEKVVNAVYDRLIEWAEMLSEYCSLCINTEKGTLEAIPLLLPGWTPNLDKLPLFLLRLGIEVDWTSEKACFSTVLREIAFFNSPEPLPSLMPEDTGSLDDEQKNKHDEQVGQLKHVVFPAMRYLQPPSSMIDSKAIVHVASLENLYKVFERC
ncbi:DNA mismatch repair protein MutL [Cystobasidium minutum MCA 4210]|uniref:DNA mismatch repair protein MutL n=1 Tax=Cystobasidium minutum MCA 4210 TaxID=1397322 RepID=UPI0034CDA083|eukprot:jgi/Rhomi1/147703/e_gw1.9.139.1